MSKVIEQLIEEWENHKGEFVLTQSHKLERFISIGYDGDDYYYVTYDGRTITWNSAVGKLVYLKGKIDDGDYNEFIRLAKLNHGDQIGLWKNETHNRAELVEEYKEKITTDGFEDDEYLTDICWSLN